MLLLFVSATVTLARGEEANEAVSEIKIAFYGTNGHQISYLVKDLRRARLVGVAGVEEEAFEKWKSEMPDAYAHAGLFGSLDDLLEKSGAELVSICSPRRDAQHLDIVEALEAGLHVYAEKPLATTLEGLASIEEAARRTGREVRSMTGTIYEAPFRAMRQLVAEGKLGTLVQVFAQKSYPYHDGRPQDRGIDGGLIQQAGIHAVGFVRFVTGLEFDEVFAMDTTRGNPHPGELQIAAQVVARLSGDVLCTLVCNYCNPPGIGFWGNDQVRVHGTGGMAELTDGGTRSMLAVGKEKPAPLPTDIVEGGYPDLLEDFINHLLDGTEMLLSQDGSFTNTRVVNVMQESADRGEPLSVAEAG